QGGVEEEHLTGPTVRGVPQARPDGIVGEVVRLVVRLPVVAETAPVATSPGSLQEEHLLVGHVENPGQVRRTQLVKVRDWRPRSGLRGRWVTRTWAGRGDEEAGDKDGGDVVAEQAEQQLGEGLFALADDGEVVVWRVQHPGVVGGDLRAAEDDADVGPPPF